MSTSKGSKIAMAIAGLVLVAGTATAIAMTQKEDGAALPLFGTEESAPANTNEKILPEPSAETGEASPEGLETIPGAEDEGVPGMNNLENSDSSSEPTTIFDAPAQKTE